MKKRFTLGMLAGSLALSLLVLPGAAAANDKLVEVENAGSALIFIPIVEFDRLILTVTGPCGFEFRDESKGDELVFQLDGTTIDGRYTFNIFRQEGVDPSIVKVLREARVNFDEETPKQLCRDGKLPGPPQVQAAGFTVRRGKIIYDPGAFEKALDDGDFSRFDDGSTIASRAGAATKPAGGAGGVPTKDFVINDDLIVDGSACIGFDCVNGEVFSFDTIRLKENNLRIKFDDTSVVPSFPANDWQLTANESANGGASKFSIEDVSGGRTPFTVEANARSHSLYVDDGGRIGSRTSTPSVEIHTIDGDTPTLRLQQDGSSGFEPQTWDVAGNETNFFIRDVTNGSTLPLRIRPTAPSNAIFVDTDGDIGMGTSAPGEELHVRRTDAGPTRILIENTTAGLTGFNLVNTLEEWRMVNDGRYVLNSNSGAGNEFVLEADGDLTITGNLVTGGGGACDPGPCDGTFIDYELESIEEHAAYMWENKHLWGVGPTPEGAPINLTKKTTGILHELEKAHIYIEQLHERLETKEAALEEVIERLARLEQSAD